MASRASIAGHPIHPMLVPLPIGLFLFSFVADIGARLGWGEAWPAVAMYCIGGGIVGAIVAAVFGFMDFLGIGDRDVKRVAAAHMAINIGVVILYLVNFGMRLQAEPLDDAPFLLSGVAILMLIVSGWLGGRMVYVQGVGVARRAERRRTQLPVARERRRPAEAPMTQA